MIVMSDETLTSARRLVAMAMAEDRSDEDVTSLSLIDATITTSAAIEAREVCIVAGAEIATLVFQTLDPAARVQVVVADGERAQVGEVVLRVEAKASSLLTAERTALNFMQRLSGIATMTARFVEAVRDYPVTILDTRKTHPGWRLLDKYAVRCGGGANHRMNLRERAIIKDNHRALWAAEVGSSLADAVTAVRKRFPDAAVEVEVETLAQLDDALRAAPEWIMLDNMPLDRLREAAARCAGRCLSEASGGVTLANVVDVAKTGVDAISLGCLTHSAPAVDLSLEVAFL